MIPLKNGSGFIFFCQAFYQQNAENILLFIMGLKTLDSQGTYKPRERIFSFYQICQHSHNQKDYMVRKIIYNEYLEVIQVKEKLIDKNTLKKFMKKSPTFKYQTYPYYNLDMMPYPDADETLKAYSLILNDMVE